MVCLTLNMSQQLFLLLVLIFSQCQAQLPNCENDTIIGHKLCLTEPYYNTPPDIGKVIANTSINLLEVMAVNSEGQSITLFVSLEVSWFDPSLSFSQVDFGDNFMMWYELTGLERNFPWRPTVTFANQLSITRIPLYGADKSQFYWMRYPNEFHYGEKLQVEVACNFEFSNFPFDSHKCNFDYGDPILQVHWLEFRSSKLFHKDVKNKGVDPITVENTRLPFEIKVETKEAYKLYATKFDAEFSFTGLKLTLKRDSLGKLLAGYYMLTGVFAALSTLSYSIPPEQIPGRMGLLVTLYLITANTYSSVDAPRERGFSYIELWMVGVQLPMIVAMLEFGYILAATKFAKTSSSVATTKWADLTASKKEQDTLNKENARKERFKTLDKICGVVSLVYFFLFNLIYWVAV